ncbi:MAG: PLP-dependent aminotransferase family protein [Myxococcales bacterium]|nr:PLP-dependent aminotransferase family protein [Myxococcales bacterium]
MHEIDDSQNRHSAPTMSQRLDSHCTESGIALHCLQIRARLEPVVAFVLTPMADSVHYSVQVRSCFANWMCGSEPQTLRRLMGIIGHRPNILSFALGWPDPALFPRAAISGALAGAIEEDPLALQLGPPLPALRREIAALMRRRGVACDESHVFLTTGAQQALDLLARLLVDPGASVALEEVTYPGMHMALRPLAPTCCYVPTDEREGIDIDALQALLSRTHPRFIYVMSDGHNPLGVSLTPTKRKRLVDIARAHQIPIIEDDPYGFYQYDDGDPLPPIRALERHMPEGTRWSTPKSGMFVWVRLPSFIDTTTLLEHALERGVAFLPGPPFAPGSQIADDAMRLCFASCPRDRIEEGIATLGGLAAEALGRTAPAVRMVGA